MESFLELLLARHHCRRVFCQSHKTKIKKAIRKQPFVIHMIIQEIKSKKILVRSRIQEKAYCLNPYIGCQHGCRYCYATFMKRFTNHKESWGEFVDVKVNAPDLLAKEIQHAHRWEVIVSSVTDPYQPLERRYQLTRQCLKILLDHKLPVSILTKSSLVLRDMDLLSRLDHCEVGLTITTDDERVRKLFEPLSSPIPERIRTLETLHREGIRTYAFIGPILPQDPQTLARQLMEAVDFVYIDRMNYWGKVASLYSKFHLEFGLTPDYFHDISQRLREILTRESIETRILF